MRGASGEARWGVRVGVGAGVVALAASGYFVADAAGLVPGFLTSAPIEQPQAPFITAAPVAASLPADGALAALPVAELDPSAPRPSAAVIQALAEQVRADSRTGASTTISVVDYLDGAVYADVSAADPQVPASTTKLLTVVAAVGALGPDATLATTVRWDAAASTLTLVAGGDVMLARGAGHGGEGLAPGADAANGWAGIGDLADQVVDALGAGAGGGASSAEPVRVLVDDSAFVGPAWPDEWPTYARDLGYAAPVTGLAVDIARVRTADNADAIYAQRYTDPSISAGKVLAAALADRGVAVEGDVARATGASATSKAATQTSVEVARVEGAPLAEVARYLLSVSDNTVAEVLGRVLAIRTGGVADAAGGAAAIVTGLEGLGVATDGLALFDGAGFSDRNQVSAATLVSAIEVARERGELAGLLAWLPLSGLEGTVASRYEETPVAGFFRAKTGSLTGVTTIAGVVMTADGRALSVAVLADGMPAGQAAPKAAIDAFLASLAECGCDG